MQVVIHSIYDQSLKIKRNPESNPVILRENLTYCWLYPGIVDYIQGIRSLSRRYMAPVAYVIYNNVVMTMVSIRFGMLQ